MTTTRQQLIADTVRNMRRFKLTDTRENRSDSIPGTAACAAFVSRLSAGQWSALHAAISAEYTKQAAIDASNARIAAKLAVRVSA